MKMTDGRVLELFRLRLADPAKWTFDALARRFRVHRMYAHAILLGRSRTTAHPGHPDRLACVARERKRHAKGAARLDALNSGAYNRAVAAYRRGGTLRAASANRGCSWSGLVRELKRRGIPIRPKAEARRPLIPPREMLVLFRLRLADPKKWSARRLGRRFKVGEQYVLGILAGKKCRRVHPDHPDRRACLAREKERRRAADAARRGRIPEVFDAAVADYLRGDTLDVAGNRHGMSGGTLAAELERRGVPRRPKGSRGGEPGAAA